MKYNEIIQEYIVAPYGQEIENMVIDAVDQSDKNVYKLRNLLQSFFIDFANEKIKNYSEKALPHIDVRISKPIGNFFNGGMFRCPDEEEDKPHDLFQPLKKNTLEIWIFISDGRLGEILNKNWQYKNEIKSLASIFLHEFIHAVQFVKSHKFKTLSYYTKATSRPKVDNTRRGKRGGYESENPMRYYGTAIEIEAFAAEAAAEIISGIKSTEKQDQLKFLRNLLKSPEKNNTVINTYRSLYHSTSLIARPTSSPSARRQKTKIWNLFKKKLYLHLMDYAQQLVSNNDQTKKS